jgi:hypothetical protein
LRYKALVSCRRASGWVLGAVGLALVGACSGERAILGEQCPKPGTRGATLAKDAGRAEIYGTTCAPCTGKTRFDAQGCPIYVTWASCGGDICIGSEVIPEPKPDGGGDSGIDDDAGSDEDAAVPEDTGER